MKTLKLIAISLIAVLLLCAVSCTGNSEDSKDSTEEITTAAAENDDGTGSTEEVTTAEPETKADDAIELPIIK